MKKKIALLLSMLLVFLLVACGSKEANQTQTVQTQDAQSQGSGQFTFQGEVPLESKLLFGGVPGQGPGGGQEGGQGFGPGGGFENFSPEQRATAEAMRAESGGGGRDLFANRALIDALIGLLEGKLE